MRKVDWRLKLPSACAKTTSGKGRPLLASAASTPPPSGAVGYQTTVGSVRSGAPGKVPFGIVGRDGSTSVSDVSPTPYGPGSSKRSPARVSRTSVVAPPQPGSAPLGARGQTSLVESASAVPSMALWSTVARNAQSGVGSGLAPHVNLMR